MQLFKLCFILDNVANLPREEVLANFKLEFMECCKYGLRDPGLKILYLFMKPIYLPQGDRKYNNAEPELQNVNFLRQQNFQTIFQPRKSV